MENIKQVPENQIILYALRFLEGGLDTFSVGELYDTGSDTTQQDVAYIYRRLEEIIHKYETLNKPQTIGKSNNVSEN